MDHLHGLENVVDHTAELSIVPVVHRLQIDLVTIRPRAQVIEHLRSSVAVGDECCAKTGGPCFLEDLDRPLSSDQWFVITAADHCSAVSFGHCYQSLW